MITIPRSVRIFIGKNPIDMRKSIDGLMSVVQKERNQQGLDNQLITTAAPYETPGIDNSPVVRRERLGGLLNFYYRRAA